MNHKDIVRQIKDIQYSKLEPLFKELKQKSKNDKICPLSRKYNDIADYHTLSERLNTRGFKNINFYEFYERIIM